MPDKGIVRLTEALAKKRALDWCTNVEAANNTVLSIIVKSWTRSSCRYPRKVTFCLLS